MSSQSDVQQNREEELNASEYFNLLFSLKKPKDIKAGLASGTKNILKGVAAGAVGFVVSPIYGAFDKGFIGVGTGLVAGTAGAVIFPTCGLCVGGIQVLRGIGNQYEAIVNSSQGKSWDQEKRTWVDKPMQALVVDDPQKFQQQRSQWEAQHNVGVDVSQENVEYYELLQIPKDATETQIRKQYYLLARCYHPDKAPNNPQANAKFQKLGEAYQILSNPTSRAQYDKYGMNSVNNTQFMDQAEFFNMLFGSDKFEPIIGELLLTSSAKMGQELTEEQVKKLQYERQENLVKQLQVWLAVYVSGKDDEFQNMMTQEAEAWVKCNFGSTILITISRIYHRQAEIYSGKFIEGSIARFKQKGDSVRSQVNAIGKFIEVIQSEFKMQKDIAILEQQYNITQDQKQKIEDSAQDDQKYDSQQEWRSYKDQNKNGHHKNGNQKNGASSQQQQNQQENDQNGDQVEDPKQKIDFLTEKAKLEEARLPVMIEAMWAANAIDIENTLKIVCMRLFQIEKDKQTKTIIANGLKLLADIFRNVAQKHNKDHNVQDGDFNVKQFIDRAMEGVAQKRQQQDDLYDQAGTSQ